MDVRDVSITQALHEGGIGPLPIGVIGSPETSHADHGFVMVSGHAPNIHPNVDGEVAYMRHPLTG